MKILQRTPDGRFFLYDTETTDREWLLSSELERFKDWKAVLAPQTDPGFWHWISPDDIPSDHDNLVNSLITEQ